ncbi:MAG: hypothetical protein ACO3JL_06855 [Myxococcota bacterium]
MGHCQRQWRRLAAATLLPLVLCAGTTLVADLMRCRAMGTVVSHCCCPPPSLRVAVDASPHLEQGCCEGVQLRMSVADPLPLRALPDVSPPPAIVLVPAPRHDQRLALRPVSQERRSYRAFDPTGPPPRLLHCTLLL